MIKKRKSLVKSVSSKRKRIRNQMSKATKRSRHLFFNMKESVNAEVLQIAQ